MEKTERLDSSHASVDTLQAQKNRPGFPRRSLLLPQSVDAIESFD